MSRVSLGLPVYNGDLFIKRAVESILSQTFRDLELIIVDNNSTDRTHEICADFASVDPRVKLYRNDTNIGAPANFNRTFQLASAPYFKWVAVDDVHEPTYLERCVEVLDRDPSVVLCHTRASILDEQGKHTEYQSVLRKIGSPRPSERFGDFVLSKHACFEAFGVVRREAMVRTNLLQRFLSSDRVLLSELALMGRVHLVNERLFLSGEHQGRSVRIPVRQRVKRWWFEGSRPPRWLFPHWRVVGELAKVVARSDVDLVTKARCYAIVGKWVGVHWRHLGSDIRETFADVMLPSHRSVA